MHSSPMRSRITRRLEFMVRRYYDRAAVFERVPGSRKPFHRITALVNEVNAAIALKDHAKIVLATANMQAYRSRGHAHKPTMSRHIGGQWSKDRSRYMPAVEDRKHAHG
jgi:hypothetical protein